MTLIIQTPLCSLLPIGNPQQLAQSHFNHSAIFLGFFSQNKETIVLLKYKNNRMTFKYELMTLTGLIDIVTQLR